MNTAYLPDSIVLVDLLQIQIDLEGESHFGQVKGGFLALAGVLASATFQSLRLGFSTTRSPNYDSGRSFIDSYDWDMTSLAFNKVHEATGNDPRLSVYLLPITYVRSTEIMEGLILTTTGKAPGEFQRIGKFHTHYSLGTLVEESRHFSKKAEELGLQSFHHETQVYKYIITIV